MDILYHHRTRGEGVERVHILGIVRAFRELGHEISFVSPPGIDMDGECPDLSFKRNGGNGCWRFINRFFPEVLFEFLEVFYNLFAFAQMISVTRKKEFDFIYERYALFSFAGILFSKMKGIPILLEVNDSAVVKRNRTIFFRKIACRIEQWAFCHSSGIITVSCVFKKIIADQGVEEKRIFVTPNAVDPRNFIINMNERNLIKKQYQLHGKMVIGYVGGFFNWHRLNFLMDTITNLISTYPNIHCLLVGDGVTRPILAENARKMGVERHFTFTGKCRHNQIAAHISAMDISILPDANDYCSPVKLFEYMAMGKPVFAPRLPNVSEIITSGRNGILFEPGDKEDLEKKLAKVIENEELRRNLGDSARRTVYEKHLWIHNARKIVRICKDLETD
jgi:glycosyltransferase involved in cell wall biosynthesis